MGEKRGACAHAPAGPVAAAACAAVRGVCAVGRPYRARPGVPHPCGAWALVPAVRRVPHGAGAAAAGSSGRAAGKRGSACFAASRYHLGRGARRALCPHGGRLCAPVGKGAALGGRGRAAGGRRFAQPAGIRFFGAALSGCVPAQRDFVFYVGSLPFRAIEVMLLFRKAHKYFMLHEQARVLPPD